MADLGAFAADFVSLRALMAAGAKSHPAVRWKLFASAAAGASRCISRGLNRAEASDALFDLAHAHGLDDESAIQDIVAEAFHDVADVVPLPLDDIRPIGISSQKRTNGRAQDPPLPIATAYVFPDPAMLPIRQFLGNTGHYVRENATATVAPGGFGKTTLTLYELITMAQQGLRVWYISGEDPKDEIDRRIAAHCQYHNVDKERITNLFYVDDKSSFPLFLGTSTRTSVVKFDHTWLTHLEREIRDKQIDVVALDPFISFHAVAESDNGAIDQIVKRLGLIAQTTKSCIEISHHVRKSTQGFQAELTVDDTRGGSAIVNAVRSCRVFNRMSDNEAALARVKKDDRPAYIRVDKGKRNMAPAEKATWWHIVSVHLPNGDNVQAIEPYKFPEAFEGMTTAEVDWVQKFLREGGPRRASSQSADWLGHHIGLHCGRDDTHEKGGAIWANKIISQWLTNKVFKKISMRDPETRKTGITFYADNEFQPPDDCST
jgi:AAA domain